MTDTNQTDTQVNEPTEKKPTMKVKDFIRAFGEGTLSKRKRKASGYSVITLANGTQTLTYTAKGSDGGSELVALRLPDGRFIFNAARLRYAGTTMAWGSRTRPWRTVWFQQEWSDKGYMGVPFNVLQNLSLDPTTMTIVEKANDEYLNVADDRLTVEKVLEQMDQTKNAALIAKVKTANSTTTYGGMTQAQVNTLADKLGVGLRRLRVGFTLPFGKEMKSSLFLRVGKNTGYDAKDKPFQLGREERLREPRHFIGACLFNVSGKQFLFDVDRGEVKNGLFNPFVVVLSVKVKTIAEAYASLKPKAVVEAEKKGLKVLRQGEWFFVPTKRVPKGTSKAMLAKLEKMKEPSFMRTFCASVKRRYMEKAWQLRPHHGRAIDTSYHKSLVKYGIKQASINKYNKQVERYAEAQRLISAARNTGGVLRAGNNRPNRVAVMRQVGENVYVTGKVSHDGREHKDLNLKGWYKAMPNTAVSSFQVSGDVD